MVNKADANTSLTVTDPLRRKTTSTSVDIGGNDRKYTYDSFGRLKTSTDLGDGVYGYSYGDDGLSQITSPTGETLKYEYDDLGNLKKTIASDGSAVTNTYNSTDNRLAKTTLASGDEITFQYDSAGRIKSQSATKGGTTSYAYNADGAVTTLQAASGNTTYTYDDKGRVSTMTDVNGSSISYRYELGGKVDRVGEKASATATERFTYYGYDILGNLTSVKDATGKITTMIYDTVNRLSEKTLPNGVKTIYSYDELDQVTKIETKNSAGTVLSSLTYERKGVGEPSKITREDGSFVTYTYDSSLRLTKESYFDTAGILQNEITYTYDASGKRLAKNNEVYAYNNSYQLQSVTKPTGTESYGYDADGRVSLINRDGQTLNLSHDSYDRLTQANNVSYLYDASGNRIKASSGGSERRFLQASNGGLDVTELLTDASGNVISDYVYGNGSTPFEKIDSDGNSIYYLTDAMGSVIGEVDGDGNLITRIQYDGFGNVRSQSGTNSATTGGDFRFQGQWLESESGLYYFRARDYDSKTGLFLSRDAVAPTDQEVESMNPYQFAYQNPLIYSDPSGMFTLSEVNASQVIQSELQRQAYSQIREILIDKAKGVVTNILTSTLKTILPSYNASNSLSFLQTLGNVVKGSVLGGTSWERLFAGSLCSILGEGFAQSTDWLWLQPRLSGNIFRDAGTPRNDGYNCNDLKYDKNGAIFPSKGSGPSADFIIKKDGGPRSTDPIVGLPRGQRALLEPI